MAQETMNMLKARAMEEMITRYTADIAMEVAEDTPEDDIVVHKNMEANASEDHVRVAVVVPVMAQRFRHNITTYQTWRRNGFDMVLVVTEGKEKSVVNIIEQKDPQLKTSLHIYTRETVNAGIAKDETYKILKRYLGQPNFMFAVLMDDSVDDIIDTRRGVSIMSNPGEFCRTVKGFAELSPVFGGTVAAKRHPQRCQQEGTVPVRAGFLQQAVIFSCQGTPTLSNHFQTTGEYVTKMCRLSYRDVPFGEDVAFQISLYQHGVLRRKKSAQFWGIGVSRIKHKSATKRPFLEIPENTKKAIKDMIIYLRDQGALKIDPMTNKLTGVRVIPGRPVRLRIKSSKRERPWRDAFNYTFPDIVQS